MNIYISGSIAYDRIMDFPGFFSDHILPTDFSGLHSSGISTAFLPCIMTRG